MASNNSGLFSSTHLQASNKLFTEIALQELKESGFEAGVYFLNSAKAQLESFSKKGTEFHKENEDALTEHAARVRSLNAHLVALAGNLEALKLSQGYGDAFEIWASHSMGWLKANLQAMEYTY